MVVGRLREARSERAGGTGSPGPEPKVDEQTRNSLVTTV